jgi:hypothetical protein
MTPGIGDLGNVAHACPDDVEQIQAVRRQRAAQLFIVGAVDLRVFEGDHGRRLHAAVG